jgi:hypothetical protein
MLKLSKDEAELLSRLQVSPDFQRLREGLLTRLLIESDKTCRSGEGVALFRAQGRSSLLIDLLDSDVEVQKTLRAK